MGKIGSDLAGKTALITGGATGIGRAIATALPPTACVIAVADIDLDAARDRGHGFSPNAVAIAMDVTKRESVEAGFAEAAVPARDKSIASSPMPASPI